MQGEGDGRTRPRINSVLRATALVELLALHEHALGVTELAHMLHLDAATVHRLLSTLVTAGWVRQEARSRKYRPSLRLVLLGRAAGRWSTLAELAAPVLREMVASTGETAHVGVMDHGGTVLVQNVDGPGLLSVNADLLHQAPLHCTATGKALLAFLAPEEVDWVLGRQALRQYTPKTLTRLPWLRAHLNEVRRQGYAVDDEEYEPGVRCLAAPILDSSGVVVAAIGITGPSVRLSRERLAGLAPQITDAAARLSAALQVSQRQPESTSARRPGPARTRTRQRKHTRGNGTRSARRDAAYDVMETETAR